MTTKQQKDLNLTLALSVQMQSMLHTLDKLSHEPIYKREFKQRCENFYSWLEKIVEPMTETLHEDISPFVEPLLKRFMVLDLDTRNLVIEGDAGESAAH